MEPYREDRPFISIDTETSLLDRLLNAGIPLTRALKYFRDNPEGSALETLKLAAEDVVPFYGTYRNDGDWSDYAKEAAIFGIPMPYIKYPKGHARAGEAIPNNLKEGYGNRAWADVKSRWKNNRPNARKLYADPNARRTYYTDGNMEGGLSTRSRTNATADAREAIEVPAGPYNVTNTGSDIVNRGQTLMNNNNLPTSAVRRVHHNMTGDRAWQGDMYPPGRRLANTEEGLAYALEKLNPSQHEYVRKLNDVINENEYKWEYLINKTRPARNGTGVIPKQDIADIAMAQGRPDIAARVMSDDKPRLSTDLGNSNYDKRFSSYKGTQNGELKDNAKWKDVGNRQVEKELREQYSMLPEDMEIRQKFAEIYGVPDLYQSWMNDPLIWAKHKNDTQRNRRNREISNRSKRRKHGWENPNQ